MPFVKGQSGNPAGKPLGAKNFTTKVREALLKIADGEADSNEVKLIKKIIEKATVEGDTNLIKHMWDQMDGRPVQKIEQTDEVTLKLDV